jgi:sugar phosphate isomerase/epimerase
VIELGCHSDNFGISTPDDMFAFIRKLGFTHIDVAPRSIVPQCDIVAAPDEKAKWMKDLASKHDLRLSELFLGAVSVDGKGVSPSAGHAPGNEPMYASFEKICRFAEKAGFASIMGSAGSEMDGLGWQRSFDNAAATLARMCEIAESNGIFLNVEPSRLSLLNTPKAALEMIACVPKLRYTLDFLHYEISGTPQRESMALLPYARHLHARQACAGWGKCPVEFGEIDYDAIIKRLRGLDWSGVIAMEYWCTPDLLEAGILAVDQNILMRYELKRLIRKYYP